MSTIVRLDKIKATAHNVSIQMEADLENGRIVELGDLLADGEGYNATVPVAVDAGRLVFHASMPMGYNEPDFEDTFVLKAGAKGRAFVLETGDIVTLTDDAFASAPAKGDVVGVQAGNSKMAVIASPTNELVQAKVIAKELLAGKNASVIEIL